ncbi:MAG TPA: hypothetical protein VJM53_11050 [Burkholderiales bacterium]|nr:hypothetical protein [Burkholderiales bacterium]
MKFWLHSLNRREKWCMALTALALLWAWTFLPSGSVIHRDALQNLTAAYNLSHYGVMSLDQTGTTLEPTLEREPVPIFALAIHMKALGPWIGDKKIEALQEGGDARLLKYSNLFWGALLVVIVVVSTVQFTRSIIAICAAIWLSQIGIGAHYDTLLSELPAATLLTLASFLLLRALQTQRRRLFVFSGLCFGLLCLTKASFLYVSAVFIFLLLVFSFWRSTRSKPVARTSDVLMLAMCIAVCVLPWMTRNYVELNTFKVSGRGGVVLYTRALKDLMTWEEYRGSFYAYAPVGVQQVIGLMSGYSKNDLAEGGSLERLNRRRNEADKFAAAAGEPERALSFYPKAMGTEQALINRYAGEPNAKDLVDAELKQQALEIIKEHPWRHAALILPFLWRGAPYVTPILLAFLFVFGFRKKDPAMVWYVMPALGLIGFYAVLTHFISRYADPIVPLAAICFIALLYRNKRTPDVR